MARQSAATVASDALASTSRTSLPISASSASLAAAWPGDGVSVPAMVRASAMSPRCSSYSEATRILPSRTAPA